MLYYPKNVGVSIRLNNKTVYEARCEACKALPMEFSTEQARAEWGEAHAVDHLRWTINAAAILSGPDDDPILRAMPGEIIDHTEERARMEGKAHYLHNDRVFAVGLPGEIVCYARDLEG